MYIIIKLGKGLTYQTVYTASLVPISFLYHTMEICRQNKRRSIYMYDYYELIFFIFQQLETQNYKLISNIIIYIYIYNIYINNFFCLLSFFKFVFSCQILSCVFFFEIIFNINLTIEILLKYTFFVQLLNIYKTTIYTFIGYYNQNYDILTVCNTYNFLPRFLWSTCIFKPSVASASYSAGHHPIQNTTQLSETTCLHNVMAVAKSGSVGLILSNSPEHRDQKTYIGIFKTGAVRIYT